MVKVLGFLLFFLAVLAFSKNAFSIELYAEKTGKDCIYCHKNASGGTDLTQAGEDYKKNIYADNLIKRVIRFFFYYIHLLFAIAWFGTILYVHLILKPSYASKRLPRGELILGWLSIFIMAVSGGVLTYFRFDSLSDLISSRFGIILIIKVLIFLLMFLSALFVTTYLGPKMRKKKT